MSMRQSRLMSLVEAMANVVVGLLIALATQLLVFPILGLQASLAQNFKLALVITGVSIVRGYALRRLFEALR
jgi:branched-subunit amino acid transport protein